MPLLVVACHIHVFDAMHVCNSAPRQAHWLQCPFICVLLLDKLSAPHNMQEVDVTICLFSLHMCKVSLGQVQQMRCTMHTSIAPNSFDCSKSRPSAHWNAGLQLHTRASTATPLLRRMCTPPPTSWMTLPGALPGCIKGLASSSFSL